MFLTATNILAYLSDVGLVSSRDVITEDFAVVELGRRNRNFSILRQQNPLFVKQVPIIHPETVSSFLREAACMQLAADANFPVLHSVAPRLRRYDPERHVLAYDGFQEGETLTDFVQRTHEFPPMLARQLGFTLASCHLETARPSALAPVASVFPGEPPWVLTIGQHAEQVMPNMGEGLKQLVAMVRSSPEIYFGLADLHARWLRLGLAHGDLKWDNIMLVGSGGDGRELRLIDWELADVGDPLWDVAGILGSFLQFWLLNVPITNSNDLASAMQHAPFHLTKLWPAMNAFWMAYIKGTASAMPGWMGNSAIRLGSLTGARLVLLAFELLSNAASVTNHAALAFQLARYFLVDPYQAAADILGFRADNLGSSIDNIYIADMAKPWQVHNI